MHRAKGMAMFIVVGKAAGDLAEPRELNTTAKGTIN
jgi:hypothetical protein